MDSTPAETRIRAKLGKPMFEEHCLTKVRSLNFKVGGMKFTNKGADKYIWYFLHEVPQTIEFDLWWECDMSQVGVIPWSINYIHGPVDSNIELPSQKILFVGIEINSQC